MPPIARTLVPCPACDCHVRPEATTCPVCGASLPRRAAGAVGLALQAGLFAATVLGVAAVPACAYGCPDDGCGDGSIPPSTTSGDPTTTSDDTTAGPATTVGTSATTTDGSGTTQATEGTTGTGTTDGTAGSGTADDTAGTGTTDGSGTGTGTTDGSSTGSSTGG